jgi:ubiquitin-conjugating enzyme E2 J2
MEEHKVDPQTGKIVAPPPPANACSPETSALRKRPVGSHAGLGAVVEGGNVARDVGQSWLRRNRMYVALGLIFGYVVLARALGEPAS